MNFHICPEVLSNIHSILTVIQIWLCGYTVLKINIVLLCDQEPGGPGRRGVVEQPAGGPGLHVQRDLDRHKQVLCQPSQ
mgnify:CR=1 FL=1